MWVTNSDGGTITQIEPLGARPLRTIDAIGRPEQLTVADATVWVVDVPPYFAHG